MKTLYVLTLFLLSISVTAQQTFFGNGRSGFGGTMGVGSLRISNAPGNSGFNFIFSRGTGLLTNAVVIYIDSKTGGFNSTAGFMDNADGIRRAISGYQTGTEKSVLTFPSGFLPDYAIAFNQNTAGIWQLVNGGPNSLVYVASAGLSPTGTNTALAYNFSATAAQLGITGLTASFSFLANYVSETAFRSNEFLGDAGPTGNPGYGDYTATTYNIYSGGVLPVTFTNVRARFEGRQVKVSWTAVLEHNVSHYEIYRSSNGNQFAKIGTVIASNIATGYDYIFDDLQPVKGRNYYQVISVDKDGRRMVTDIVHAESRDGSPMLSVYAAPGTNTLNLKLNGIEAGEYTFRLFNNAGQLVHQYRLINAGLNNTESVQIPSLNKGIYRISLAGRQEQFTQSIYLR